MSSTPNNRPSLAQQIELDRRRGKAQQIIARLNRGEDERVGPYKSKAESDPRKTESESRPASYDDGDFSGMNGSRTPVFDLENSSTTSPRRDRQSRGSTSTPSTKRSTYSGFSTVGQDYSGNDPWRRKSLQSLPPTDNNNPANPVPCEDVMKSPELRTEYLDETRRGIKGVFSDIDRLITGLRIYGPRERSRKF
jgi:hypothetical protein